jgi:hypothetical protein
MHYLPFNVLEVAGDLLEHSHFEEGVLEISASFEVLLGQAHRLHWSALLVHQHPLGLHEPTLLRPHTLARVLVLTAEL